MVDLNFEGFFESRLSCLMVLTVLYGILYGIRLDLTYMKRGELRRDQYTALVQMGLIRSAGTVKPNMGGEIRALKTKV